MNGEITIIFAIVALIIIFIVLMATRKSSDRYIRRATELEREGRFLDAIDFFSRASLEHAASMVLRTPEASQILALRRLEKIFPPRQIERAFIQLGRTNKNQNAPHAAASAFELANKPFAAAKVFIDIGGLEYVPAAVQILDRHPSLIHDRDQAIRNLARHAYSNKKFMEAAELLRTIGAEEEANTVLIAAANEMRKLGLANEAEQYFTSINQPTRAIQHYLHELEQNLQQGDIEKSRRSLTITKDIVEKLPSEEKQALKEDFDKYLQSITKYDRLLKILDSARDLLRKNKSNQAIALYDELLEILGSNVPTPILAEAALANEERNPQYASELYQNASLRAKSSRAAESFKMRAKKLEIITKRSIPQVERTTGEIFEAEVEEFCSVCRMNISEPSSLVRCPDCGSPAHYTHIAEWLKIRGVCPICKKRVKIQRPKTVTF
ncbi:MAG: E3 ubiquitin protein ligase [Candidatus Heimdallarchaeota archaeon]|nr:MAG: E3 ubiquitin protein ligase [Candidatus Heimdallarchaeota archaeon]